MPIFSCFAHAACANGLSTLTAMTSAPRPAYASRAAVRSHISLVQTLVNASGKNSSTVFFLPKLLLSFTSTRPDACLDLRVKSGAFDPVGIGIIVFGYSVNLFLLRTFSGFAVSLSNEDCALSGRNKTPGYCNLRGRLNTYE